MMNLPPYLKRCYRFPRSVVEDDGEEEWCTPSRRRHRLWGRAFELSVSVEELLKTTDSFELLTFLWERYSAAEDEDTDVEQDDDQMEWFDQPHGFFDECKIVWMSDHIFAFVNPKIGDMAFAPYISYFEQGTCKVYSIKLVVDIHHFGEVYVYVVILQSPTPRTTPTTADLAPVAESDTPPQQSSSSSSILLVDDDAICVMDVLLSLVVRSDYVRRAEINAHPQYGRDLDGDGDGGGTTTTTTATTKFFPASMDALKAFVGDEVWTDRTICLHKAGLSLEQWHAVTHNCSSKVTMEFNYLANAGEIDFFGIEGDDMDRERSAFMEAAIQDHCPAKIKLRCLDLAPPDRFQLLLSALESTTLLEELDISWDLNTEGSIRFIHDAILRTPGLHTLHFEFILPRNPRLDHLLTPEDWKLFCGAIASHPTLQFVYVYDPLSDYPSFGIMKRDQLLIEMIRQNMVLRKVMIDSSLLYNQENFYRATDPVLALNPFRQVIKAIRQETDSVHRKQLFTATLLSKLVRKRPVHCYLLLKENFDLMLEQDGTAAAMRRFISLETTILSSNLEDDERTWLARKRNKRSRHE